MKSTPHVSAEHTTSAPELEPLVMLPRGAALLTTSGALAERGITAILHAASAAMTRQGGIFDPTPDSIANAVHNALLLARRHQHAGIAIPMIGGAIFLPRLGITLEALAELIVRAAWENRGDTDLVFVGYGPGDAELFREALRQVVGEAPGARAVTGDIREHALHGASAIVNAANMEVRFGGGLSGAIASATGCADRIDAEAHAAIEDFWRAQE